MLEFTQGKNHSNVKNVKKGSLRKSILQCIWEFIFKQNLIYAKHVENISGKLVHWKLMKKFIQEKSHLNVKHVDIVVINKAF